MSITSSNLKSIFIRYVSLNVMGMIGLSCYILADTFFISVGIGPNGLTALNLVIPIYSLINGLGLMMGMGGATRYAILQGSGTKDEGDECFSRTVKLALLASIPFLICAFFFTNPICRLLGADEQIMTLANTYLKVMLFFTPAFFLNNVFICFVRNDGAPRLSMTAMLTGSISNIILDYIFIFPLGWGMFGAIFATGLAPVISLCVLSTHFWRRKNHFGWSGERKKKKFVKDICGLGGASLVTELSSGMVILVFNMLMLRIAGNMGVAAYGVIANLALVVISIFTGIGQGSQPIISDMYGKGNMKQGYLVRRYAVITAMVIAVIVYGVGFFFAEPIVSVFNQQENRELAQMATEGLRLYFTAFFFMGINIVYTVYYGAVDEPRKSLLFSLLRGLFVIIPMALILSSCLGITGIWLAPVSAEAISMLLFFLISRRKKLAS